MSLFSSIHVFTLKLDQSPLVFYWKTMHIIVKFVLQGYKRKNAYIATQGGVRSIVVCIVKTNCLLQVLCLTLLPVSGV